MALQLLPHLLTLSAAKTVGDKGIAILVATSGDTGKAALEGFKDVKGTRILVFYPQDGVSEVQKLQMTTQEGANVGVCGVDGNFDDTQTGVKNIFTDPAVASRLAAKNMMFSSANSINWGRLVPQIVYYVSAYCDLVQAGEIKLGETVNVAVPTGNFGNILAAYYAKHMGLPLGKLICASNENNVLTDFIRTGTYDRNRDFHMTASPSMDILISSNLERLLSALYESDEAVAALMNELKENGVYSVSDEVRGKLQAEFFGGFCDEEKTRETIRNTYTDREYLLDTHTAVGLAVREEYREQTGDNTKTIVASTANPYKFAESILFALRGVPCDKDEFEQAELLSKLTRTAIPPEILALRGKKTRFSETCERSDMITFVTKNLGV
jgi:threonine synthase